MSGTVGTVFAAAGALVGLCGFVSLVIGCETYNSRAQWLGVGMIVAGVAVFLATAWAH